MNRRMFAGVALVIAVATGLFYWRSVDPDNRLQTGRSLLAAGDADAALRVANALAQSRHVDHARFLRADVLLSQGDPAGALTLLNQVEDQGDLRRDSVALAGRCQLLLKNPAEAFRAFEFVLAEQPNHVDGHRGLAAVYYDQGALLKCLHHLGEVARLDPADGRPYRMMGLINADLNRPAEAVASYRNALERTLSTGTVSELRVELAEQLMKLGDPAAADAALGPASASESARSHAVRAEVAWSLGQPDEAAAQLDAALVTSPEALPLLRLRGRLFTETGDWSKAVIVLERASKTDSYDLTTLHQLALAYDRLDRSADAAKVRQRHEQVRDDLATMTTLNREADAQPWDPTVRWKLADVCDRLGKRDLAAMWRQSAAACQARRQAAP
jgi:tetratricopeptide (TPR) repeat protein